MRIAFFVALAAFVVQSSPAQTTKPFDGRPWNVSTGNVSVTYIQASPVGSHPRPGVIEPPPSLESMKQWKSLGLVADEDYIAWGAVEREPGKWQWEQHDAVERVMHAAGLKYVVYDWAHFPPVWLRDGQKQNRTLMKCLEHGQETNYLSVFDPRTIEWYDHFYKAVHDHFGDKIDDMYACILGPYGEGNYPLNVPDWINIGHCHEGYWCGDEYAIRAFATAMRDRYGDVDKLNAAWGTTLAAFEDVRPPKEVTGTDKYKITPGLFATAHDRRRWLDFITWYHQAIIDFAGKSVEALLKYYPHDKVRLKPGGTAGGINPIAWGTYSPGYAKMAAKYGIVLQPADCQGAVFADKWLGTAYAYYGVKLGTEPASSLDKKAFVRRMFSDASCGASQLFTYEFAQHVPEIQRYVHLYTGHPGQTRIALFCPTTLYRLGGDLGPTIRAARKLRDLADFDVLDELLIADGALTPARYDVLLVFQGDVIDQPVLDKITAYARAGGRIIGPEGLSMANIDGKQWFSPDDAPVPFRAIQAGPHNQWLPVLAGFLEGVDGCDGHLDGLWTTRRGRQTMVLNTTDKPVTTSVGGKDMTIEPHEIGVNEESQ